MDSEIFPYILGAITVGSGLAYKKQIINGLIRSSSWAIDKFVELKWAYFKVPSSHSEDQNLEESCELVRFHGNHIVYRYQDKYYISPALIPPIYHDICQVYDDEEYIVDIRLYQNGIKLKRTSNVEDDWVKIYKTINCFAGPLYDFHGTIPTISDLESFCEASVLKSVDKIVVSTEYLREFVIT